MDYTTRSRRLLGTAADPNRGFNAVREMWRTDIIIHAFLGMWALLFVVGIATVVWFKTH